MTPILTLLSNPPFPDLFKTLTGWVGWFLLLGLAVGAAVYWRGMQKHGRPRTGLLILFLALVPLTNLFLGIRLFSNAALPPTGIPAGPHNPAWMIFSALPWMLAAGFLGPVDALLVGAFTGLTRCLWDTHNLFSILTPALLGVLFSAAIRQRYRTPFYRLMRLPLAVSAGLVPIYILIFLFGSIFSVTGGLAARLDFALTNLTPAVLTTAGELLGAGLFVQIIAIAAAACLGRTGSVAALARRNQPAETHPFHGRHLYRRDADRRDRGRLDRGGERRPPHDP